MKLFQLASLPSMCNFCLFFEEFHRSASKLPFPTSHLCYYRFFQSWILQMQGIDICNNHVCRTHISYWLILLRLALNRLWRKTENIYRKVSKLKLFEGGDFPHFLSFNASDLLFNICAAEWMKNDLAARNKIWYKVCHFSVRNLL